MNKDSWWIQLVAFILLGSGVFAILPNQAVNNQIISQQPNQPNPIPNVPIISTTKNIKVNLSVSSLKDLKVKEGSNVTQGQVLADREEERKRLTAQRKQTLLSIAKIEQTPLPVLKVSPPLSDLPSESYAEEEAAIEQAELKFSQVQRNYNSALTSDPFISARANVDFAKANVESAYRDVELQQKKLEAVSQIKGLPPEMLSHETEKLKIKRTEWEKAQAEYIFRVSEGKQVEQARKELITSLQNDVESARASLLLAQAKLRTAKEKREREEYQDRITKSKEAQEYNTQLIYLSQQKLEREFKLTQLQENLNQIDDKLSSIAVIRSPYSGIIKKIKIEKQTNNNIELVLYLSYQ